MIQIFQYLREHYQTIFRYILLSIFLYFSCYLLVNYMTGLVKNPDIKKGVSFFTVVLDVGMQVIILARAKQNWGAGSWKKGQWKRRMIALILFAFYAVYLIFFAILSAVGFFMVEVQKTEAEITAIQETQSDNRERLKEISDELKAWNIQLATEGKTGYGDNSKEIKEEIRKLKEERAKIETENRKSFTVRQEAVKSAVNSFEVLSKKLGVNRDNLETLVFGIAVIMLYVFIIILTEGEFAKKPASNQAATTGETLTGEMVSGKALLGDSPEPAEVLSDGPETAKKELLTFTEALFNDSRKLNGIQITSLKTGIPPERCNDYRKYLDELQINGVPVINKKQGGSIANFPKGELLEYIRQNVPGTI